MPCKKFDAAPNEEKSIGESVEMVWTMCIGGQ